MAVLLPLIPLVELASQLGADLAGDEFPAILAAYYPARAFALIGFALMFYQFVIGARLPIVEKVIDKRANLLKSHRTLGKWGGVLMLLHGVLLLIYDLYEAGQILFNFGKLLGVIGLFLILAAVIAAWWFKPLQFKYDTWKKIHLLAYIVFPIIFVHAFLLGGTLSQSIPTRVMFSAMFAVYLAIVGFKLFGPSHKPGARKKKAAAPAEKAASTAQSGS